MVAKIVLDCAHARVIRDTDPDYRYCVDCHHTVFVGVPMDLPLEYSKTAEKPSYTCVDCGGPVSGRDTKRCAPCSNKKINDDLTRNGKRNNFGRQPLMPKREPAAVTARAART